MKEILDSLNKTPYRVLMLLPSFVFLFIACYAIYKDKETWIYASFACVGILLFLLVRRHIKDEVASSLNSDEWLKKIANKLDDCGSASIYLRRFDHPDNFKSDHREVLLKIIDIIKNKIDGGSKIRVIAYHPDPSEKSGVDWLRDNAKYVEKIENFIILKTTQPSTNSSSIYIFDDRTSFYNKIDNGKVTYHAEDFSSSIIHELMIRGFSNLASEQ